MNRTAHPNILGAFGLAKVVQTSERTGGRAALLVEYVVEAPKYHPFWSQYWFAIAHLRQIDGEPPVEFTMGGATHQIWVLALDPNHKLDIKGLIPPDNKPARIDPPHILTSQNHAFQITAPDDAAAAERLVNLVGMVCQGQLSPDTDFRAHFQAVARAPFEDLTPEQFATMNAFGATRGTVQ